MSRAYNIAGINYTIAASNHTLGDVVTHRHKPDCSWLLLPHLAALKNPPPLIPDPELSGVGVILGFSIMAYFTLVLLILHYLTVHNVRRTDIVNVVDDGLLSFFRQRLISWKPSRRFEYAMERSVLILSDTQLVTGLGILAAGYSQLQCGISAYHWQMMVYIAWFASFSFLSAMTFLEGYFQTNNSMRLIRVGFMIILASLLIGALLPTGSRNWLNLFQEGEGYYPSLSTTCFYKQMGMGSFTTHGGPKIWSMVFSSFVVAISYLHCGIRLFDPGAGIPHRYLRAWPGSKIKKALYFLERKALRKGLRAKLWHVPYLALYAIFTCLRAFYDISGSMLLEIIWLTFAIAWGTIKVWSTRSVAQFNFDGSEFTLNQDVSQENSWSFGQTLPLVLILLPLLSMAQTYLDNDAKSQEALASDQLPTQAFNKKHDSAHTPSSSALRITTTEDDLSDPRRSTTENTDPILPLSEPPTQTHSLLPRFPYSNPASHPWYCDLVFLLLCQTLMLTAFSLWVLTELASIMGISAILRNRLFLIWVFGVVPLTSLIHLGFWYVAALVLGRWRHVEQWLKRGAGKAGQVAYWTARMGLVATCLMATFWGSLEAASPYPLDESV
ncbi:hypothetical protein CC86DRAFT_296718 [Ophiobolus disseminans]|uniref:Uncharacterized protein n=1 Tax=Ophiobolus disseminans TaxID=1469910 RepID=A0A6A6ZUC8_9PLEO|nr:hypothetical protein CC86DRAFT_296718 [Ophiobolus disseminans]